MTLNALVKIPKVEVNVGIKEERQLLNAHNSSKLEKNIQESSDQYDDTKAREYFEILVNSKNKEETKLHLNNNKHNNEKDRLRTSHRKSEDEKCSEKEKIKYQ